MKTKGDPREILALGMFGGQSRLGERVAKLLERGREFSAAVGWARLAASAALLLACVAGASLVPRMLALAQDSLRFGASSIRPAAPQPAEEQFFGVAPGPQAGFRARDVTLIFLLNYAFGNGPRMPVSGAPSWAGTEKYDVIATPESGATPPTKDQLREMLRNMLSDRFKLQTHREQSEMSVLALTVGKGGSKLKRELPPSSDPEGTRCDAYRKPMCTYVMQKAPMSALAGFVGQCGRIVIDRTGLDGEFDVRLKFDRNNCGDDVNCVSVQDALQDQLGLKIEETKAPVEVLIVDHVERPDPN